MLNKKSILLIAGCILVMLSMLLVNPYQKIINHQVISWDGAGYYLYLPSAFIYHDFKSLHYIHKIFYQYNLSTSLYQAFKLPNGNYVLNYPMGSSILQLPFFLIANIITPFTPYPADGFSLPYQLMIVIAGLFYCLCGLMLLYKLLSKYYNETPALICCLTLFLCTNLYNYAYTEPCMSHVYLFFLVCSVLYLTDKWYVKAAVKSALLLGLAMGLIMATRPTVGIILIVCLLWKVNSVKRFVQNLVYLGRHWKYIFLALVIALIPIGLEISYWKYATGHWFFNTYGYQHIGFEFNIKQLLLGIGSIRKGWIVFTPLTLLMLVSFYTTWKNKFPFLIPVVIYIIADVAIVFSWQIWYYGGGFGARAMVEAYAVLALPYTGLIKTAITKKIQRAFLFIFISLCCLLNLFQTWQYINGIIYSIGITSPYEYKKLFLNPVRDVVPAVSINSEGLITPYFITSSKVVLDTTYSTPGVCNVRHSFFAASYYSGKQVKAFPGNRLRFTVVTGYMDTSVQLYNGPASVFIGFERKDKMYFVNSTTIPATGTAKNPSTKVIELQVPEVLRDDDICKLYVTNNATEPVIIFKQKIEVLQTR